MRERDGGNDRESAKSGDVLTCLLRAHARAALSFADGASEAAVFAAALESVLGLASGAVDADEEDCTTISRRRNLLQTSSSELGFTVTISGAAAAIATTTSIAASVQASIDGGSFATALVAAASSMGVTTLALVVVSGASADTMAPTPSPTAAPVTASTPAPTTTVIESGSWRLAPGMGLLGTCIAVLATAWI